MFAHLNGHSPLHDAAGYALAYPLNPSLSVRRRSPNSQGERAARVVLAAWLLKGLNGRLIARSMTERGAYGGALNSVSNKVFREAASSARKALFLDGRSLDLKMVYLRLILNYVVEPKVVRAVMKRAGFASCEADTYLDLITDEVLWAGVRSAILALGTGPVNNDITVNPAMVRAQAAEDFKRSKIQNQAAAAVRYKLRFVVNANCMTFEDLEHDLMRRATAWYYNQRPFKTRAHALNYARSAISSGVQELIDYWTDPSRQRLRATEHGWESTVVSFDAGEVGLLNMRELAVEADHGKDEGSGCLGSTMATLEEQSIFTLEKSDAT